MRHHARLDVAFLCAAGVIALTSAAVAQTAAGPENIEAVTVTGSRVISSITNSPTPLTVVTSEQLQATTPTTIPDALNKLPIFFGSNSQRTSANAASNSAGNVLNLRNFGANRTLVLLDGHRVAPTNFDGTVDTNVLPQMLVQRVDVVTGGASAVYGSDAVTGVVNFVLDKNFDGFKYNGNAGISKYGDAASYQLGVAAGTDIFGGRGHIEGSLRFYHQDKVFMTARPYGAGDQAWTLVGTGSAANPYVNIQYGRMPTHGSDMGGLVTCTCSANNTRFVSNGVLGAYNAGTVTGTPGVNDGGDGGGYFSASSFQSSLRTAEAFGRFSYDISDDTVAYVNVAAAESATMADYANGYINPGAGRGNIFYNNNPYLPAAAQAALKAGNPGNTFNFASFFESFGDKTALETGDDFRTGSVNRNLSVNAGVSGTAFGKYTWDLYYTHGENRVESYMPNNINVQKLDAAEDAVLNPAGQVVCQVSLTAYASLYPGCVAMNPFGPNSMTDAMYQYITDRTSFISTNTLDNLGGSMAGEVFTLPAGPVKAALSAEARWQSMIVQSSWDPAVLPDCTGLRLCQTGGAVYSQVVTAPANVHNNVFEFASEVNIPLLKDLPLVQELSADLAGRYTDYSTSGSVETWKIGLDHHVNDSIRFRGTASVDIRAPNLNDLYQPVSYSTGGFADRLTRGNFVILKVASGNADLKPEVAHTYTAGVVLTPDFLPGFTASVDYYRIRVTNAITNLSGSTPDIQDICINSGGTSPYCTLLVRPYPYTNTTLANFPTLVKTESINSASVRTEGVDIELDYSFDMADLISGVPGSMSLRNLTSYQPFITTGNYPGAEDTFQAMPKLRNTGLLSYKLGDWGVNLQDTWFSGFAPQTAAGQVYVNPHLHSFNTLDVSIDKQLYSDSNALDLYFSVQNIMNAQPDIAAPLTTATGLTYPVPKSENAMGRYFIIGIRGAM
jgi:outer membrane receptor protein involved in Fe transport